jgi:hypothetical protein
MPNFEAVADAASRLSSKDEFSLELLIGMRENAIIADPSLKDNPDFEPLYQTATMGALDDIRALGRRILRRWNVELHAVVCSGKGGDPKDRKAVLDSLNLGEAAVIAAVVGALLTMGAPAAIAAVVAPLMVKRFIWPAKDELCAAWGEGIKGQL